MNLANKNVYAFFLLLTSIIGSPLLADPEHPSLPHDLKKQVPSLRDVQKMTGPIEFPGLPAVDASAKFLEGYSMHMPNGCTAYHMKFASIKGARTLISSYAENFSSKNWKVSNLTDKSLTAEDNIRRHVCIIDAHDTNADEESAASILNITYEDILASK